MICTIMISILHELTLNYFESRPISKTGTAKAFCIYFVCIILLNSFLQKICFILTSQYLVNNVKADSTNLSHSDCPTGLSNCFKWIHMNQFNCKLSYSSVGICFISSPDFSLMSIFMSKEIIRNWNLFDYIGGFYVVKIVGFILVTSLGFYLSTTFILIFLFI